MKRYSCFLLFIVCVSFSFVYADDAPAVPAGGNKMCPVMTDQPARADRVAVYQGKKVYLCCEKCLAKFNATPTKYLVNLEGFAPAPVPTKAAVRVTVGAEETKAPERRPLGDALGELYGKLHVVVVHFPISLLLVAGLVELVHVLRKRGAKPSETAMVLLVIGTVASIFAVNMGWVLAGRSSDWADSKVLPLHRWIGTAVAGVAIVVTVMAFLARRKPSAATGWSYRIGVLLCAAAVGAAGHLGGELSYGENYYSAIFQPHEGEADKAKETNEAKDKTKDVKDDAAADAEEKSTPATTEPVKQVSATDAQMQALLFGTPEQARLARIRMRLATVDKPSVALLQVQGQEVFNEIDRFIVAAWKKAKLPEGEHPPDVCDDATFCRRVYLDVTGVIPTTQESSKFAEDKSSDKRVKLVDDLLGRKEAYAAHWTPYWEEAIASNPFGIQGGIPTHGNYQEWIFESFKENKPYDVMLAQLIDPTEPGFKDQAPGRAADEVVKPGYIQNDTQTKTLQTAANVGQFFLGTEMKCASCHSHFLNDEWRQDRFLAFAGLFSSKDLELIRCEKHSDKFIAAHFAFDLPQAPAETPKTVNERLHLAARLITDPANPRFAKTAVNRLWKRYLGLGLFEPADDFRLDSPPAAPELLDWLAYDFMEHGYDIKRTIRLILTSRTYQLKYDPKVEDHFDLAKRNEPRYWRSPSLRKLTAEQLVDSMRVAANQKLDEASRLYHTVNSTNLSRALGRPALRNEISTQRPDDVAVVQSLELLNGQEWSNLIYSSPLLMDLAKEPDAKRVVNQLFAAALSRKPNDAEAATALEFIQQSPKPPTTMPASVDVVWLDDELPKGASPSGMKGPESWQWVTKPKPVFSGERSHMQETAEEKWVQHYAIGANPPLVMESENDVLYTYVFVEKGKMPKEIMLQFNVGGSWEHRGVWGNAAMIPIGAEGTEARRRVGNLPKAGQWVRLEVTAKQVGLTRGTEVNGISFDQYGGKVYWDKTGVVKKPMVEIPAYGDVMWSLFTSPEFQYIR